MWFYRAHGVHWSRLARESGYAGRPETTAPPRLTPDELYHDRGANEATRGMGEEGGGEASATDDVLACPGRRVGERRGEAAGPAGAHGH